MTFLERYTNRPKPILGYTTRLHLLLDIDHKPLDKVKQVAYGIMLAYSKVGDCLIMRTDRGYHLVFDNTIGYNLSCKIIERLAKQGLLDKDYEKIRGFRGDMTLRTSPAYLMGKVKGIPEPVCYISNPFTERYDGNILSYWYFLKLTASLFEKVDRQHIL